jgi:hypothetical protein
LSGPELALFQLRRPLSSISATKPRVDAPTAYLPWHQLSRSRPSIQAVIERVITHLADSKHHTHVLSHTHNHSLIASYLACDRRAPPLGPRSAYRARSTYPLPLPPFSFSLAPFWLPPTSLAFRRSQPTYPPAEGHHLQLSSISGTPIAARSTLCVDPESILQPPSFPSHPRHWHPHSPALSERVPHTSTPKLSCRPFRVTIAGTRPCHLPRSVYDERHRGQDLKGISASSPPPRKLAPRS